jgi:hypothetical protein
VSGDVEPLPEGAILLHVGPFKTGSTAIQQSLFDQRHVLAEHGVLYPDKWRRLFREGHSLMRWAPKGIAVPPESVWDDFAERLRARTDVRVCLSTEDFGRISDPARIQKLVADLGADRLHVLAVARAYHRLLPSHWQERVKSTERLTYDAWLHQVLEGDDSQNAHRSFWSSHDIERMAGRWLKALPPDRFTVVVSDDSDRLLLSRVFEGLLDVPPGTLAPRGSANASLSANAAEVVRRVNDLLADGELTDSDRRAMVRFGLVRGLQGAGRGAGDVSMPPLPAWARPLVAERSASRAAALGTLGIRVVGDPQALLPPADAGPEIPVVAPETISVEAAAAGLIGVLEAAERERRARRRDRARAARHAAPSLAETPGRAIMGELARRARRRLSRGR